MAYFYSNDGLIALTWVDGMQMAFDFLTDLFDCDGLGTNVHNMASMVFQLCHSSGVILVEAYTYQMAGEGPTYKYWLRQWVLCTECGV